MLLSKADAELLFEMLSQRYERGSTTIAGNPPSTERTEGLASERITGALHYQLTHHAYTWG